VRAAFLLAEFPCVSETFILDQITGLIDRGCDIEIFSAVPASNAAVHPEVEAYGLLKRHHVPRMPESMLLRPLAALRAAATHPGALGWPPARSLNVFRYGPPAASLRLFFETMAYGGHRPFDVVHCHFGPSGLRGLSMRDLGVLEGKLVTSFYGYDVSEFPGRRKSNPYRRLFAEGELFLALSGVMRSQLIDMGCDARKIVVHALGVNPRLFPAPRPNPADPRAPLRILTIGRMVPKKGMEYALRAVAPLLRERPGIAYTVLGDGPLRLSLERLAAELGVAQRVQMPGWKLRPEIVRALAETDILLAPSITAESGDQEGTPVAIMEAMTSGIPVVSTLHAGIPEVVDDGISGYLVAERDVAGLASALRRLADDPTLRARMGQAGRRIIEERHDIDKLNDGLLAIYRDLTNRC